MSAVIRKSAKQVLALVLTLSLCFWGFDLAIVKAFADQADPSYEGQEVVDGYFFDSNGVYSGMYHYRDSYFYGDAYKVNRSLASFSMITAMAAFGPDGDSEKIYKAHPNNLNKLLTEVGFKEFEANTGYVNRPERNSIGVGIANKTMKVDGVESTVVAVIIRGGSYGEEWGGNTILGYNGEAEGFETARNQVVEFLSQYLLMHQGSIKGDLKLWIVGFSRASATANLTGNFLNYAMEHFDTPIDDIAIKSGGNRTQVAKQRMRSIINTLSRFNAKQENLYCYGFEVPAGGIEDKSYAFVAKNNKNIFNYVNNLDLVPLVAPKTWNFVRYGTDVNLRAHESGAGITLPEMYAQYKQVQADGPEKWEKRLIIKDGFHLYEAGLMDIAEFKFGWDADLFEEAYFNKLGIENFAEYLDNLMDFVADHTNRYDYVDSLQIWAEPLAAIMQSGRTGDLLNKAVGAIDLGMGTAFGVYVAMGTSRTVGLWTLESVIDDVLNNIIDKWEKDPVECEKFKPGELKRMREVIPDVAEFAAYLVSDDYEDYEFEHIGTAFHYAAELFDTHDTKMTLSYLRAADDNYNSNRTSAVQFLQTHELTISNMPDGATVEIYRDGDESFDIATVDSDGKVTWRSAAVGSDGNVTQQSGPLFDLRVRKSEDKTLSLVATNYMPDSAYEWDVRSNLGFKIVNAEDSGTATIKLNYTNRSTNDIDRVDPVQDFENKEIVFPAGAKINVDCQKLNPEAAFSMTAPVKISFIKYDPEVKGHYKEIADDLDSSLAVNYYTVAPHGEEDPVDWNNTKFYYVDPAEGNWYDLTVNELLDDDEKYRALSLWQFNLDKGGNKIIDENGTYEMRKISKTPSYVFRTSLDTSMEYAVLCESTQPDPSKHSIDLKTTFPEGASDDDKKSDYPHVRISNLTSGESTTASFKDVSFEAHRGDKVTVEAIYSDQTKYRFAKWAGDEVYADCLETSFTFVMPDDDVNIVQIALEAAATGNDEASIITSAAWIEDKGTPKSEGWSVVKDSSISDMSKYYLNGTAYKCYTGKRSSGGGALSPQAYLKALDFIVDDCGNYMKFKQWRVYYDKTADTLLSDDDLGKLGKYVDGGDKNALANPELIIGLDNLMQAETLRCIPVYEMAPDCIDKYNCTIKSSGGKTVKSGAYAAGENVTVDLSGLAGDEEFVDSLTVSCTARQIKYKKDDYLNWERVEAEGDGFTQVVAIDKSNPNTATFVMPFGDVVVTPNGGKKTYTVTTESVTDSSSGKSTTVATAGIDGDSDAFCAGDKVTVKVRTARGWAVSGFEARDANTDKAVTLAVEANDDGTYTFTMPEPGMNLVLTPTVRSTIHKLTTENATVTKADSRSDETPADFAYGDALLATPETISGKYLMGFEAKDAAGNDLETCRNADGSVVFKMSDSDASFKFVYADAPTAIEPFVNTDNRYCGEELIGVYAGDGYSLIVAEGDAYRNSDGNVVAVNAGTYKVTARLNGGYKWADGTAADKTLTWEIKKAKAGSISIACEDTVSVGKTIELSAKVNDSCYTCNGKVKFSVEQGGTGKAEIVDGTWLRGIEKGTVIVKAVRSADDNHSAACEREIEVNVVADSSEPADPANKDLRMTLSATKWSCTGKAIKPKVTVKNGSTTLKAGTDYTVSYANNVKVGSATAIVKLTGKYSGTLRTSFKIVANQASKLNAKLLVTAKGEKMTVTWGKVPGAIKYKVQTATSKGKFKTKVIVKAGKKLKAKVKKAKRVRVVAYMSKSYGKKTVKSLIVKPVKKKKVTAPKELTVKVAKTKALKAESKATLRYWSSNPAIAKVTKQGKVTGLRKGTSYVYAMAPNGTKSKTKVAVK